MLSLEAYRVVCYIADLLWNYVEDKPAEKALWDDFFPEHIRCVFAHAYGEDNLSLKGVSNGYLRALWSQCSARRETAELALRIHARECV
jgi:hypothetical protein